VDDDDDDDSATVSNLSDIPWHTTVQTSVLIQYTGLLL